MTQNNTIHAEVLLLLVLISTSICFTLFLHLQCAVLRRGRGEGAFLPGGGFCRDSLRSCGLPQTERYYSKPASPISVNISLSSLGFQLSELNGIVHTCDLLFQAAPRLMERATLSFSCFSRYSSYLQRYVHEISIESRNSWSFTEPLDTGLWAYFSLFHCRAASVYWIEVIFFNFSLPTYLCLLWLS